MIDYIHTQLSIWGKWSAHRASKGLGYPGTSPMFKGARFGGGYGSQLPTGINIDDLDYVMDTDEAVKRLSNEHKALCVEFYVISGSAVEVSRRMGVTKKRLYELLHIMQYQVMGHLQDVAAG